MADRAGYLRLLLDEEGRLSRRDIMVRTGLETKEATKVEGVWLESIVLSGQAFGEVQEALVSTLRRHQQANPLEPGMPRAAARAALDLDPKPFDEIVEELHRRGLVVADTNGLRTPDHTPASGGPQREELLRILEDAGSSPPGLAELQGRFEPALIRSAMRSGELVQISPDLIFPAATIEALKGMVARSIAGSGPMTVAAFRDIAGTTRKYAVPLLEYLDQTGFTRRQGDTRVLGPKAGPPL